MNKIHIQVRAHIKAALDAGVTEDEILEALHRFTPYFGLETMCQTVQIALEEFARLPWRGGDSNSD